MSEEELIKRIEQLELVIAHASIEATCSSLMAQSLYAHLPPDVAIMMLGQAILSADQYDLPAVIKALSSIQSQYLAPSGKTKH